MVIMNKKIGIVSLLMLCMNNDVHCRYYNNGGGAAFGASLGGSFLGSYLGNKVANSSGNQSDPYAPVDRYDAQQMLRERKAQSHDGRVGHAS